MTLTLLITQLIRLLESERTALRLSQSDWTGLDLDLI